MVFQQHRTLPLLKDLKASDSDFLLWLLSKKNEINSEVVERSEVSKQSISSKGKILKKKKNFFLKSL